MAAQTVIVHKRIEGQTPARQRIFGIVFLVLALLTFFFFSQDQDLTAETLSTFSLNTTGSSIVLPDWVLTATPVLNALAVVMAIVGGYQLARGFQKRANLALAGVVALFVFSFLVWASAGKTLNLTSLISTTLLKAVPITIGALSGLLCERVGIVNIAVEGMMLSGAMVACLVASLTKNLWIGLLGGVLAGGLLALLHSVLSIKYKINQIISGTVINILATGLTSYISSKFLQVYQDLNNPGTFQPIAIPGLVDIPILGPVLFNNNIFVYLMFAFLAILQFTLFNTRWGLRLRAVGEHPKAADTLGINVIRTRYIVTVLGGMMAGFGGSYLTLGSVGRFDEVMTAGRGFIGIAAMIFGNWMPVGSFGAGLLFGFADSLAARLAILQIEIPSQFLLMAPYLVTMIVLAGVVGNNIAPAAEGIPYEKE